MRSAPFAARLSPSPRSATKRALMRRYGVGFSTTRVAIDASGARRSLQRSLRALNTNYVDLLFLHDPLPGSVRSDEVSSFLEDTRAVGLIRSWEIAGAPATTGEVAQSFPGFRTAAPDDITVQSLLCAPARSAFITFGVISRALAPIVRHVRSDESARSRWENIIGADCGDP